MLSPPFAISVLRICGLYGKKLDNRGGRPSPLRAHFRFAVDGRRFAYCRIRKNGCSAMQQFIIETSPHKIGASESGYQFLRKHHSVPTIKALRSAERRILIFRDPVERIQSLFVNKFLQRSGAVGIFRSYRAVTGRDPTEASFQDFITNYVARLGDVPLDPHVWPQHWHLCPVVYDHVFSLHALTEGMAQIIGQEAAARYFRRKVNTSPETDLDISADIRATLSTIYAEDFRMIRRIT